MSSPVFDTLKAANSLKAAGFDDRQAEAVVTTVGGAIIGNLVTKPDLESALRAALEPMVTRDYLEQYLDKRLEPMVTRDYLEQYLNKRLEPMATKSDLQLSQHQVTTRLGALVVASVGVLGVLIGLF